MCREFVGNFEISKFLSGINLNAGIWPFFIWSHWKFSLQKIFLNEEVFILLKTSCRALIFIAEDSIQTLKTKVSIILCYNLFALVPAYVFISYFRIVNFCRTPDMSGFKILPDTGHVRSLIICRTVRCPAPQHQILATATGAFIDY